MPMPTLMERFEADYRTAMKAGERVRIDTLRLIKAGVQRAAIDKRKETLDEQEIIQVLSQQAKQRQETIESARQSNRQDVVAQATEELKILRAYLPEPLSEEAIRRLIDEAIQSVGSHQGQVMKYVMGKAAGTADGKVVSQLVAARLKTG
jgi:uncharacterized protein YqeY